MKHLLPKELAPITLELHRYKYTKRSQVIYVLILIFLFSILISLPFIKLDVFTSTPGMIRTESDPFKVRASSTGVIQRFAPEENSFVSMGDTLLVLGRKDLEVRDSLLTMQLDSLNDQIEDLQKLTSSSPHESNKIKSGLMRSSHGEFHRSFIGLEHKNYRLKEELLRQEYLYEKGVIALSDLESSRFLHQKSTNELRSFHASQKMRWKENLDKLSLRKQDLLVSQTTIRRERENLILLAPVSGYIQYLEGFRQGVLVREGTPILEIVPESGLIVKCYVSSEDIGLVKPSQEVEYRIRSLKRQGLGPLKGRVISISPDVRLEQGSPVFEVKCSLDSLPNASDQSVYGKSMADDRDYLKNGMTLMARFRLARRTVFDLILEDIEDAQMNHS